VTERTSSSSSRPATDAPVLERLAVQQLHDEERRTVLRHVIVRDPDGTFVADSVRHVPLAKKAGADLMVCRQLGVQELDGDAAAVAVSRCVHRRHAAHAEQNVQTPLLLEHLADACLGTHHHRIGEPRHFVGTEGVAHGRASTRSGSRISLWMSAWSAVTRAFPLASYR
jgi:hypothetical protein